MLEFLSLERNWLLPSLAHRLPSDLTYSYYRHIHTICPSLDIVSPLVFIIFNGATVYQGKKLEIIPDSSLPHLTIQLVTIPIDFT